MSARPFAFKGVVRLTRLGTGYLLFTLVIGFAALNTGNNSLYIGLAFMLGGLVVSGLASKGGLEHIGVELLSVDEAWAGRPVHAMLRLRSRSLVWSPKDVIVASELLAAPVFVSEVSRRSHVDVPVRFLFERRGPARLHRVDLYTRYPFGLFLKKRRARLDGDVVVYPRLLEAGSVRRGEARAAADAAPRRRAGGGSEIFAFREYARGDSLRHVHWKKSASLGRWVMKQHEEEVSPSLIVAVDPVRPSSVSEERFERMISEAATLLLDAIEDGADVTLILPRERIRGRAQRIRRSVFEALALLEAEPGGDLPVVPRGAILFSLRTEGEREKRSA
ncbi:MAG TPA: DUF58 domain-containing protein [Thermoanaerobaculia bacterium]|nr:DUF58 domain-containing protein [Thermoanaerobaculia bacterium]